MNEEEYADMTRDFVHVDGNLGEDSIKPISGKSLSDIYVTVIANKIDELKEVTGTRDVTTALPQPRPLPPCRRRAAS